MGLDLRDVMFFFLFEDFGERWGWGKCRCEFGVRGSEIFVCRLVFVK